MSLASPEADLPALYAAVSSALTSASSGSNRCGSCRACCTAVGSTFHTVFEVEHAYLRKALGEASAGRFRAYVERRRDAAGELVHPECPLYDETAQGCSAYWHRPYACRVFGHFRLADTRLPEACAFEGDVVEVEASSYFRALPQARALRDLNRAFLASQAIPGGPAEVDRVALVQQARAHADPRDPLDQAVLAHLEGRLEEARAAFECAVAATPHDGYAHFYHASLLEDLGERRAAALAYQAAVQAVPANPRFWLHLGLSVMELGAYAEAEVAFAEVVRLNPDEGLAHGFLGSLRWQQGDSLQALPHLQRAVALQPTNPWFSLRLGEVMLARQRHGPAIPEGGLTLEAALSPALAVERTRPAALTLLARQGARGEQIEPDTP